MRISGFKYVDLPKHNKVHGGNINVCKVGCLSVRIQAIETVDETLTY